MRIGFSLGSLLSINEIINCSRILSQHNPHSIWIPETWGMECCSMLAIVSQISKKAKIGSSILNIYSRSPSAIAMAAVTLDTLSSGRLILGLGTSSHAIVNNWHGLDFVKPVERMREYVEIIRLVISGNKVNYDGKFFHLKNFSILIKPPRKQIPIYLAAINQKMVELTWEIADGVIFYLRPLTELQRTIKKMQSTKKIDVACQLITCVSEDEDKAINRAKKTIAFYVSVGQIYREFLARNGYSKEIVSIFEEYKKSGLEDNYRMVSDSMVNELTVYGTPEHVRKKLSRFVESGVDMPILQFNPVGDVEKSFKLLISTVASDMR